MEYGGRGVAVLCAAPYYVASNMSKGLNTKNDVLSFISKIWWF